jgi:uncharacterized protein YjdB
MKQFQILLALVSLAVAGGCGGGSSSAGSKQQQSVVLESIQITPGAPSIAAGLTEQFTATGTYSDNSSKNLTNSATWSSSNTAAAIISNDGTATSKVPGSATITASVSGVSGSATLTVTNATLVSIAVSPASPSVPIGSTVQLTATGTFTDGSTQNLTSSVQWTSGAPAVAGINVNGTPGLAQGLSLGASIISATSGGISGTANLTVTNAALTSLAIVPPAPSIAQSTTLQFSATGTYTDGSTQNLTASVQWISANPSVASINLNGVPGLAKGLTPGTAVISATSGSISGSATLTVTNATLVSIAVTPANASIPLGTLQQFTATGTFSDGTTQDITDIVTWSSSKSSVASITVSGVATARNLGTVTITATFNTISGSTSLSVNAADLASLAIPEGNVTIADNTSEAFSVIGTFNDGSTRDLTTEATWTSSNPGVATIANWGLATAVSPGATTITAAVGTTSTSVTLTVTDATIVSISVTPADRTIAPATNLSFTAEGLFSDSSTQVITSDVTWASDNVAVATVASGGIATGVAAGTANISATFSGVTGSAPLYVSGATLVSIAVNPATAVLAPASTLGYTAIGTYSDGSTQNITTVVTWSSSAPSVASITSFGQVTGQSPGIATITAQQGSVSGPTSLVVESTPLTSIQVTPATATVAQQTGIPFSATGTFADGSMQDLTSSVSWTASPITVATVSDTAGSQGLAIGLVPGDATITALFSGLVGTASLTVTNATLTSITVAPSDASIPLGGSQPFIATGNFSDGTTEILTTQVTWGSSSVNVATISASGIANTAATGTTNITASMNGVSGVTGLTVY